MVDIHVYTRWVNAWISTLWVLTQLGNTLFPHSLQVAYCKRNTKSVLIS